MIYENWRGYNEKLRNCITLLTDEQLLLQPAQHMWPLTQIVQHIISVRAGWFSGTLQDDDAAMNAYMDWGQRDSPARSAAELARGLDETWAFIEARLQCWTPDDCAKTFPRCMGRSGVRGIAQLGHLPCARTRPASRRRSASLILGMNGMPALDL